MTTAYQVFTSGGEFADVEGTYQAFLSDGDFGAFDATTTGTITGTGALQMGAPVLAGTAQLGHSSTSAGLVMGAPVLAGTGTVTPAAGTIHGTGALSAGHSAMAGTGQRGSQDAGGPVSLIAGAATMAGVGTINGITLSGTCLSMTPRDVVLGGKTVILTLSGNDQWVAAGATFNAVRQAIINGMTSAQSETHGWNAEVRDKEVVSAVVRTSNTVVTVTLSAEAGYLVTASETITVTVPASAINAGVSRVAAPTFTISVGGQGGSGMAINHGLAIGIF